MSEESTEKLYPLTEKLNLPLKDKARMGDVADLDQLGFDIEDGKTLTKTMLTLPKHLDKVKKVVEISFGREFSEDEVKDLDPIAVRDAIGDFFSKKCLIYLKAT